MVPSSSRLTSNPSNSERCQLHKANEKYIDLEFLQANDIWAGQGVLHAEKSKTFHFPKVPFEDPFVSPSENLERLVYCESCLKCQIDDPLTLTLRYVQKKNVKVRVIHLPHGNEVLVAVLGRMKPYGDRSEDWYFGLVKKDGSVCEKIRFVAPIQPLHPEFIILPPNNPMIPTSVSSSDTNGSSTKQQSSILGGQPSPHESSVTPGSVEPPANESKHEETADMVVQTQSEIVPPDGSQNRKQRASGGLQISRGNLEIPQGETQAVGDTSLNSIQTLTYSTNDVATARRQKRSAIPSEDSTSTVVPTFLGVTRQSVRDPRARGELVRSSKKTLKSTTTTGTTEGPGTDHVAEQLPQTAPRSETNQQHHVPRIAVTRQHPRSLTDIWEVPLDDEAANKIVDETIASLDTSLSFENSVPAATHTSSHLDDPLPSPARNKDTGSTLSPRLQDASVDPTTPTIRSPLHANNTPGSRVSKLAAQCQPVFLPDEPGPFYFCPVEGCPRHYDNYDSTKKNRGVKWKSMKGLNQHLHKFHPPEMVLPSLGSPSIERIQRATTGGGSASVDIGPSIVDVDKPASARSTPEDTAEIPASFVYAGNPEFQGPSNERDSTSSAPSTAIEPPSDVGGQIESGQSEIVIIDDVGAERWAETLRKLSEEREKREAARTDRERKEEEASIARRAETKRLKEQNLKRQRAYQEEVDQLEKDLAKIKDDEDRKEAEKDEEQRIRLAKKRKVEEDETEEQQQLALAWDRCDAARKRAKEAVRLRSQGLKMADND